jgi:putative methionine-R-sulfoxide reductase with GAF domain
VFDEGGRLIAVLDVDSLQAAAFDRLDAEKLGAIVHSTFAL